MADAILHFCRQFTECLVIAFRDKNRVIAETSFSVFLRSYLSAHDTLYLYVFVVGNQRNNGFEMAVSVVFFCQFM